MKNFKIMASALALLAALTGCGDDSSKVVAVIDSEGKLTTDSSSSSKGNTKSSSSVAKDGGTEIDDDDTYSSSSESDEEADEDYEHGYVGYISDRSIDPIVGGVVRTWKPTENGLVMVSVDTLDKDGKVKLNTSLKGFNLVEMQKDDLRSMRWLFFREDMTTGIYVAKEGVTVTGIISEKGDVVAGAKLKILDKETTTNSLGVFEFEDLPDPNSAFFRRTDYQQNQLGLRRLYPLDRLRRLVQRPYCCRQHLRPGRPHLLLYRFFARWRQPL